MKKETFDSWTIKGNSIFTPEGTEYTCGQIRTIPILYSIIAALKVEQRKKPVLHGGYDYSNVVTFIPKDFPKMYRP